MKYLILSLLFLTACSSAPVAQAPQVPQARIALYWENTTEPHPERAPWSDKIIDQAKADIEVYAKAKDMTDLCPKYKSLVLVDQLKAIGEFYVALAYKESGFNPNSSSVDVGTKGDKGSWSVGLFQMSGNDDAAKKFGYDYDALKNPIKNIDVAMEQMKRQINKTGLILLMNSNPNRYWATLLIGNKYSEIEYIKARIAKNAPKCK